MDAAFASVRQLLGTTTLGDFLKTRPPSTIVVLRTDWTLERALKVRERKRGLPPGVFLRDAAAEG
jgi:hypothetical protein